GDGLAVEHAIERGDQVGRGVDQRAVEIEDEGAGRGHRVFARGPDGVVQGALTASWPGIAVRRTASLALAYARPSTSLPACQGKTWMPGSSPGMMENGLGVFAPHAAIPARQTTLDMRPRTGGLTRHLQW